MEHQAAGTERNLVEGRPPLKIIVPALSGVLLIVLVIAVVVRRSEPVPDEAVTTPSPLGTEPRGDPALSECGVALPSEPPGTDPGRASVAWVSKVALPADQHPAVLGVAADSEGAILVDRLAPVTDGQIAPSGSVAVKKVSPDGRVGWQTELGEGPSEIYTPVPAMRVSEGRVRIAWVRSSGPPVTPVGESSQSVPGELVLSSMDDNGKAVEAARLTSIEVGGVVAMGSSSVVVLHGAPESPAWIESFDLAGQKQWEWRIAVGWVGEYDPGAVVVLDDGVLVAVHRSKGGAYERRIGVLRLDRTGKVKWDVELKETGGQVALGVGSKSLFVGVGNEQDATTRAHVDALSCDGRSLWTRPLPYGNGVPAIAVGVDGATVVADFEAIESTDTYLTGVSSAGDVRSSVLLGGDYAYSNSGVRISAYAAPGRGGLLVAGVARGGGGVFGEGAGRSEVIIRLTSPSESGHLEDLPKALGDGSILAEEPK